MACSGRIRGVKKSKKTVSQKVKPREEKKCVGCKLHGKRVKQSREHSLKCPFKNCSNFLCRHVLTLKRLIMKIQLDVWRKRNQYISHNKKDEKTLCDTCGNHFIRTNNRGHQRHCEFNDCKGILCRMTLARRKVVTFLRKIIHSEIRCEEFEANYQIAISSENGKSANQESSKKCTDTTKRRSLPVLQMTKKQCYQPVSQELSDNTNRTFYDPPNNVSHYPRDACYYSAPSLHYVKCAEYNTRDPYLTWHPTPLSFHGYYDRPNIFLNYVNYNLHPVNRNDRVGVLSNVYNGIITNNRSTTCYKPDFFRQSEQ